MAHVPYTHPARLTLSVARISWLTAASNPLVGSSRKRMEGRATSSSPMLTRLRCPPLMPACEGAGEGDQQKAGCGTLVLPAACDGRVEGQTARGWGRTAGTMVVTPAFAGSNSHHIITRLLHLAIPRSRTARDSGRAAAAPRAPHPLAGREGSSAADAAQRQTRGFLGPGYRRVFRRGKVAALLCAAHRQSR